MAERPIIMGAESVRAILEGRKTQTRRAVKAPRSGPLVFDLNHPATFADPGLGGGGYLHVAFWHRDDGPNAHPDDPDYATTLRHFCPYGAVGDRLWVRERFKCAWTVSCGHGILYGADEHFECFNTLARNHAPGGNPGLDWIVEHYGNDWRKEPWRPSIHLPRWASRLLLEVASVSVERLQQITCADIHAEGVGCPEHDFPGGFCASECAALRAAFAALWDAINGHRPGCSWADDPWCWCIGFRVEALDR